MPKYGVRISGEQARSMCSISFGLNSSLFSVNRKFHLPTRYASVGVSVRSRFTGQPTCNQIVCEKSFALQPQPMRGTSVSVSTGMPMAWHLTNPLH